MPYLDENDYPFGKLGLIISELEKDEMNSFMVYVVLVQNQRDMEEVGGTALQMNEFHTYLKATILFGKL